MWCLFPVFRFLFRFLEVYLHKRLTSGCWQRREVACLVYSESSARRARSFALSERMTAATPRELPECCDGFGQVATLLDACPWMAHAVSRSHPAPSHVLVTDAPRCENFPTDNKPAHATPWALLRGFGLKVSACMASIVRLEN